MITLAEILKGAKLEDQTDEVKANLAILLHRLNQVRTAYGKPMTSTSGLRTMEYHLGIYKKKAALKQHPFPDGVYDESKVPKKSRHLFGQADDIGDANRDLQTWCLANEAKLEEIGLWCEDFSATPTWVHFQIVPPASGKRFFMP